jgi:anti-sigma factor RsiW
MTHESWIRQLDAYLDGELAAGEMEKLDGHLRECPGCAAESLRRLQLKKMVQSAGRRYRPDSALRERVRASVAGKRSRISWRWMAVATLAAVLFVMGGLGVLEHRAKVARENQIASELVDLHVTTLASAAPVDVISTDRHTVKPWFAGRIPFTFDLPELQGSPFELVGGRVSYLEQAPGAELIFKVRKHQISVFVFQERAVAKEFPGSEARDAQSFHLESWKQGELRYFAIGDAGAEDLRALRNLLQNSK